MKYAFLATLIPLCMSGEVKRKSRHNMQDAANVLQWHIYEGLCANLKETIEIFNILPLGSYPQYYQDAFVRKSAFSASGYDEHCNIGFCNIKMIRKYHQAYCVYKSLAAWCKKNRDEDKTIIVYSLANPFVKAVHRLKKKYTNLKICAVVADLPDMSSLSSKKSLLQKLFSENLSHSTYVKLSCVDGFVLLTAQMADYMKIKVPFCVMEGISTQHVSDEREKQEDGLKRILYSGTLHRRFGVLHLLNAFVQTKEENLRLILCGVGDSEDEIKQAAKKDSRIEFLGQVTRDQVLELQNQADVLVNPRQNTEEFTKYSFPSKNLEYLSSGTPLIAYKLDGIPDEYDDYINYVSDNSIEALQKALVDVCSEGYQEAQEKAARAQTFVLEEKNAVAQTKKIVELLERI